MIRRDFLAAFSSAALCPALPLTGYEEREPKPSAESLPCEQPIDEIMDPSMPIVDAHHHIWDIKGSKYLFPELLSDLYSGHNVTETVFVECRAMYRNFGPEALKSLGETEFANGIAAMSASGFYGESRVATGIVGYVDLRLGPSVEEILVKHISTAGGRFKGVRQHSLWDSSTTINRGLNPDNEHLLESSAFREGFRRLTKFALTFDAMCFHPQLNTVIDLARAFPETIIVLDHVGNPLHIGPYVGPDVFQQWMKSMRRLASCNNVVVKLGGLGMGFTGSLLYKRQPPATTIELAREWRPYLETAIEAFGAERCMFESNFPVDGATASYRTIWNVFKHISHSASTSEKMNLFSGTAKKTYRLSLGD